jgi:hypothetical protein
LFEEKLKTMNKLIFTFISALLLTINPGFSQTIVHGGIYANTTWTLANSPYLMDGNVVVFPGVTLTIEPGVEVRVKENGFTGSQYYLETRGTINMIGSPGALITFRSDSAVTSNYAWMGILVKNSQGGVLNYDYVSISNAIYSINYDSYIPPLIILNQCVFKYNTNAIIVGIELQADGCSFIGNLNAVYGWSIFKFTNCVFDSNQVALPIYASELTIEDCSFLNNSAGINISSGSYTGIIVRNTIFDNNIVAFDNANNGVIDSCIFTNNDQGIINTNTVEIKNSVFYNNQTALKVGWGTTVSNCEINENKIGIAIGPVGFGQLAPSIENNKICFNTDYNIDNQTDLNMFIPTNCFCLTDSAAVEEKILDGYDDITKGLISYAIFDTSCTILLETVNKLPNTAVTEDPASTGINIFPNPVSDILNVSNSNFRVLEIFDMQGRIFMSSNLKEGNNQILVASLPGGTYICRATSTDLITRYLRMVKQ